MGEGAKIRYFKKQQGQNSKDSNGPRSEHRKGSDNSEMVPGATFVNVLCRGAGLNQGNFHTAATTACREIKLVHAHWRIVDEEAFEGPQGAQLPANSQAIPIQAKSR